ncbi:MAG TPA: MDR family MFS transporter [Pseudonocardiaceae bacterium]|jgi:EmrB/QacA subfamily drug resistance transporter|nr:MDR family MFS transporter [Pseudonocardiaceae bacterium]
MADTIVAGTNGTATTNSADRGGLSDGGGGGAAPVEVSRARINAVFIAVALGMLLAALDQTIVSTALPTIVSDLGGAGHLSLVVTGYLLAETVSTALVGKFGDIYGRKNVFLASVIVFIAGSFFCGFANSMTWLIAFRAVQGLGAGGIMVTSSALIADVIPLRERGKYQGALGSVFGVVTVIGPLLGGLFVDHLSWRWAFYVNIPVAVIVIAVAIPAIPGVRNAVKLAVDYLGIILVALGASGLTLVTSWGGTTYPWLSTTIIAMTIGSVIALVAFVFVERRAKEPVLPMRLFQNPVFAVGGALAFIVGFAMLGGITFLPTFLQYVDGTSATSSGIRMLPLVVGLLLTSIISGNLVSKTGRYKIFPIVGSVFMGGGLYLLSLLNENTSIVVSSLYMFVLGVGIGLSMQVLVIAVQNTVDYADLGVATSGVTFLRTMGSSFGVAVFGSFYSSRLTPNLTTALREHPLPPGVNPQVALNLDALHKLPKAVAAPITHAYAQSLDTVFLTGVPVAIVALVLALFLKEVPMRGTTRANATDMGEAFGMPDAADKDRKLEQAIATLLRKETIPMSTAALTHSTANLDEADAWCVMQIHLQRRQRKAPTLQAIAERVRVPAQVLAPAFNRAINGGYLADGDVGYSLTNTGEAEFGKLSAGWQEWVVERLADWNPEIEADLPAALARLGRRLFDEEPTGRHAAAPALTR